MLYPVNVEEEERIFISEPQRKVVQITDDSVGQTHSFKTCKTATVKMCGAGVSSSL